MGKGGIFRLVSCSYMERNCVGLSSDSKGYAMSCLYPNLDTVEGESERDHIWRRWEYDKQPDNMLPWEQWEPYLSETLQWQTSHFQELQRNKGLGGLNVRADVMDL